MAGLFEKDFRLLLQRKRTIVIFMVLAVVLGFTQGSSFILGYLPFLFAILMVSTLSYDELDNGYQFLMTLPVNARIYVKEKYYFCISGTVIAWLLAAIMYLVIMMLHGETIVLQEEIPMILCFLPVVVMMISLMIPLQIKYGAERSRVVLLIAFGIAVAGIFCLMKIAGKNNMQSIISALNNADDNIVVLCGVLFMIVATGISCMISCRIMQNKEL